LAKHKIEPQCGDIIGDRIDRPPNMLLQHLDVMTAGVAGFGLDRFRFIGDFLERDALSRAA
jgi:hypothetical protein